MTDPAVVDASADQPVSLPRVEPWQARLEALALLLTVGAAVFAGARIVNAYEQLRPGGAGGFGSVVEGPVDWIQVLRFAGQAVGVLVAGAIVVSFLLVTLGPGGPGGRLSRRGVAVLRLDVVIGLVGAGLSGFAAIAVVWQSSPGPFGGDVANSGGSRDALARLSAAAPLVMAAAISVYVAWCAFSTLGEAARPPVAGEGSRPAWDGEDPPSATDPSPDAAETVASSAPGWSQPPATYAPATDGSEWAAPIAGPAPADRPEDPPA